jgi:hypothetical protein
VLYLPPDRDETLALNAKVSVDFDGRRYKSVGDDVGVPEANESADAPGPHHNDGGGDNDKPPLACRLTNRGL